VEPIGDWRDRWSIAKNEVLETVWNTWLSK
jgi:hypothetical protein